MLGRLEELWECFDILRSKVASLEHKIAELDSWHHAAHAPAKPGGPLEAYVPGLGTVRECIDCKCLIAGGPTRCVRCASLHGAHGPHE